MENKIERLKIRLNRLTILAFKEFKRLKYGDSEIPVSDSYVVTEAYKTILPKIEKIQWNEINKAIIPNVSDNNDFPVTSLPTTLSLESDILLGLRNLQRKMADVAQSRIFFSFVVKVVMYAAILDIHSQLDKYLME